MVGRKRRIGMLTVVLLLILLTTVGVAQAQGGQITGTVTSPGGYPLPNGTVVKLFESGGGLFGKANVNVGDGSFSLGPVPNGLYVLKAVPPAGSNYTQSEPVSVSVFNANVDVGTVALTNPQVYGRVTAPDGHTLTDADVRVYAGDGTLMQWIDATSGQFLVGGLAAGTYILHASPASDDPYWYSPRTSVTVGSYTQTITLTLSAANVYGTVADSLGNPVESAVVYATKIGGDHRQRQDLTSHSGYYAIGGLDNGTYRLIAEPPWYAGALLPSAPITFTIPGASPPYSLTLNAPPKVVTGTVETNTGQKVQNALVVAHRLDKNGRARTLSDGGGRYRLDLTDGLWALTVRPVSTTVPAHWVYPNSPQLVHFAHNSDPEGKQVDFEVLTADATVLGEVAMPGGGAPPFTVTVAIYNDEGIGVRTVLTPSAASFTVTIPNGHYKVWVAPHNAGYMGPAVEPIYVPVSGTCDLGTLTLLERDAIITGTVRDGGGSVVSGIPLLAWRPGIPGGVRAATDGDGNYVLPVVAGEWMVRPVPRPDQPYIYPGPAATLMVSSTETVGGVDFALAAADASIIGVLVDEDGNLVTDVEGWAGAVHVLTSTLRNGAPIHAGAFTILVPGGTYDVAAHLPAGSRYMSAGARRVAVSSALTATITLTVKAKDARITGGLWDPREQQVVSGVDADVMLWEDNNWARTTVDTSNGTFAINVAAGLWRLGYRVNPHSGYVGLRGHKNVPVSSGQRVPAPLPVVERDALITGTVLGPGGQPLVGARVVADGITPLVKDLRLSALSGADGRFRLEVPYGEYHLGATIGVTTSIKPALRRVVLPPDGTSGGHVLQFRRPDADISGTVRISSTRGITGSVFIWGWSNDDGFVTVRAPVTNSVGSYRVGVISNTTWHLGAVYETPSQYWRTDAEVTPGSSGATQNLTLTGPYPKPAPMAVTFDASEPQRIVLADGTSIYIPANALPVEGMVTLRVVPIANLPHQRHANIYRYGYAFEAVDESGDPITEHFNQEVIIGFAYDDREMLAAGINERFLKPAYFSTTTNEWTFPESYVVDTDANRVVMQIDHFTDFALTGEAYFEVFLPLVIRN